MPNFDSRSWKSLPIIWLQSLINPGLHYKNWEGIFKSSFTKRYWEGFQELWYKDGCNMIGISSVDSLTVQTIYIHVNSIPLSCYSNKVFVYFNVHDKKCISTQPKLTGTFVNTRHLKHLCSSRSHDWKKNTYKDLLLLQPYLRILHNYQICMYLSKYVQTTIWSGY